MLDGEWYPRLYCLGLIEAPSTSASPATCALYPRLYCLGLIEADRQVAMRRQTEDVSEALLPRPH